MRILLFAIGLILNIKAIAQVNLQTGASEALFPFFQYNDARSRLSTDLSLSYVSGNGIHVNDIASSVGTGWALNAGGVITRVQNGEPDDQYFVNYMGREETYRESTAMEGICDYFYPNGYMYSTVSPLTEMPGEASFVPYFPVGVGPRLYKANFDDREQDIYVFQFNGRSGQFVIGKNKKAEILNDCKLQISFSEADMQAQDIRTRISSFTVIDEQGIKYLFSEKQVNELFNYQQNGTVNDYMVLTGTPLLERYAKKKIVTRWFLKEIENPFTLEKIVFNYDSYSIDMNGPKHISKQTTQGKTSRQILTERIKYTAPKLTSITFPDAYKVELNYNPVSRKDLEGDHPLSEIKVSYNNNLLYRYLFNYGYFFKTEIKPYDYSFQPSEKMYARLCLTDFKKFGADGSFLPPCMFSYYTPSSADPGLFPIAFTHKADHWGYFVQSASYIGTDLNENIIGDIGDKAYYLHHYDSPFGILKKIIYPEGGSLEYDYEINKAEASPFTDKYAGGYRVAKTTIYDGVSHDHDIVKLYRYVNADGVTSSAWGFELPKYTETKGLRQYKTNGSVNIGFGVKDFVSDFASLTIQAQKQALFSGSELAKETGLTSSAGNAFAQMAVFIAIQIYNIIFSDAYKDYSVAIIKNDNFNLKNPLPFQYARVEVVDARYNNGVYQGSNGKTVFEFTSNQHYPLRDAGPYAEPYSSKQRYASWLYGLPKIITTYNSSNQPVKKIEHFYDNISREIQNNDFVSRSWYVNTMHSAAYNFYKFAFENSFITNDVPFYPLQGRLELKRTEETIYNATGESFTSEASFTYSPNNYLIRTESKKDSKGDVVGSTTYYAGDYNVAGIINDMKLANMVNVPVSVNKWVKAGQAGATEKLVNATVTEYSITSNNDIRPVQVYKAELTSPLDNTVADPVYFDPARYKDYPYLKPQTAQIYRDGNLVQSIRIKGNLINSAIYDYNKRKVIAEVKNAIVDEIEYTSFEADGGGWAYNAAGLSNEFCVTGRKCYNLPQGNVLSNSVAARAKPYIVSFWTTGVQIAVNLVNGAAQQIAPFKTGPVINGWTYYEYELPAGSSGNVSISGNGLLDEVRYFPKGAMMTTYTYDPGKGKTSDCDPNNIITRYKYDGFGRLIEVRDQYNNLIKTFEYNYKQ
jgi:YD repeat-containing protein